MTGNLYGYNLKETGKLYFTKKGTKFDKNQYIKYYKKKYTFSLKLDKIREEDINILEFAVDTTSMSDNADDICRHTIFVKRIIESKEFLNRKTIQLYSDLDFSNCGLWQSTFEDAKSQNKERFIGEYTFIKKDTTVKVELSNDFKQYVGKLSIPTSKLMTNEYGRWDFNSDKKLFSVTVYEQFNPEYGLLLKTKMKYDFKVTELEEEIKFTSKFYKLTKLDTYQDTWNFEINTEIEISKKEAQEGNFIGDWQAYTAQNLNYPKDLKEKNLKGAVRILFYLYINGEILYKSIELDEKSEQKNIELVDLAKKLIKKSFGKWNTKNLNGDKVAGWRFKDIVF